MGALVPRQKKMGYLIFICNSLLVIIFKTGLKDKMMNNF